MGRLVDGDGRALRLPQPDDSHPDRLTIHADLPGKTRTIAPPIGVTARSARHVARQFTRRLYPLAAKAAQQAAELTARQQAGERARCAAAEAAAGALPGARIEEYYRRTRIIWQHDTRPPGQHGPVQVDSVTVLAGASGEGVQAETSRSPSTLIAMLAAFAPTSRGGKKRRSGAGSTLTN
ncbi:hypothetical protein ACIHIX_46940 [Streptomyces sp. NPDC051913]|uniref:hypothetical protein n=1 Tax=Streptomyces sp. NPDC051913 TaxID=3365676 RepID=UPI0037D89418